MLVQNVLICSPMSLTRFTKIPPKVLKQVSKGSPRSLLRSSNKRKKKEKNPKRPIPAVDPVDRVPTRSTACTGNQVDLVPIRSTPGAVYPVDRVPSQSTGYTAVTEHSSVTGQCTWVLFHLSLGLFPSSDLEHETPHRTTYL